MHDACTGGSNKIAREPTPLALGWGKSIGAAACRIAGGSALLVNFDAPVALKKAEPWSLFNSNVHQSHYAALERLLSRAGQQPQ